MKLAPGVRVGPYEIVAPLGAGGMGEVWRARDPRLGRDVAIKVMPPALAHDPERRARFERECRILASLSHPNVAAVLGLEDAGGAPALIMELVEGRTLADRIAAGPIDLMEALVIARQIAEGVEYAHEKGIVHRDLKPANVKLTPDGTVKVLDFGLAKALAADDGAASSSMIAQSPTISLGTHAGVLLGTAAYMSPEQARGRPVDRRADIWAFGVVLLEMLTGTQAFAGETVSDTIAHILQRQPDFSTLPPGTPARVRELQRRCLEKDAKQRLRDIGDARLELDAAIAQLASGAGDGPAAGAAGAATPARRTRRMLLAAGLVIAALAVGFALRGALPSAGGAGGRGPLRVSVIPPADYVFSSIVFAADGRSLLTTGQPRGGSAANRQLFRRRLDGFTWERVAGTEGVVSWDQSKDGRWIYLVRPVTAGSLQLSMQRIALDGSTPAAAVATWPDSLGPWKLLPDGRITVMAQSGRSYAVLGEGSDAAAKWKPVVTDHPLYQFQFNDVLADGRTVLCAGAYYVKSGWVQSAGVFDVQTGRFSLIEENTSWPALAPGGMILMTRRGSVLAARWDATKHRLASAPITLIEDLRTGQSWDHAPLSVSPAGDLAFAPGGAVMQRRFIAVAHPNGTIEPWSDERSTFELQPVASPDGRLVATVDVPPGTTYYEVLLLERGRPGRRRFAVHEGEDLFSVSLSADGRMLAWYRQGPAANFGIWVQPVDGSAPARRLLPARGATDFDTPAGWSPDGKALLVVTIQDEKFWLRRVPLEGDPPVPTDVVREDSPIYAGRISPEGKRIAYELAESGDSRIHVALLQPDGRAGPGIPLSRSTGFRPQWIDGGRSVVWGTPEGTIMAASVSPSLEVAAPRKHLAIGDRLTQPRDFYALDNGDILFTHRAESEGEVRSFDLVLGFAPELAATMRKAGAAKR